MKFLNKKILNIFLVVFFASLFILPIVSIAANDPGLVPCGTIKNSAECGFNDLFKLINTVINFILFKMAVPIAAIMFAYAGFMLVSSAGSPEKRTKAKEVFINVAIGLIIVAGAWIFVHTILVIVGYKPGLLNWFGL